ncbi:MAG: bifunctional (p)ppGpp synthetase/guanosine-3',5'-bis(diphosphate) 3'-pyrophosphohydrolase [Thermodesulfobacteriota bacterium]
MLTIDIVTGLVQDYIPEKGRQLLREAYAFAAEAHRERKRDSGEPYITHPLEVAHILASMRLDLSTIAAGLLHSVLKEKEPPAEEELLRRFGPDITGLVKGTTKIVNVRYSSQEAYQAGNIRKLLLAMAEDVRVILIRLADRVHDMQTLEYTERERQVAVARETMDLYAPLASRIGIEWMKRELEDLAFQYLYPEEYRRLSAQIESTMSERLAFVEEVKRVLRLKLDENGLTSSRLLGRPKHLYSIYRKLVAQQIPLEKVYDKVAFRIITATVSECYEALGVVHSLWQPIPHRFKDFISSPKANGYQSLHTSVIGPHGDFMEIQIRTREMDEVAKEGVAAHWAYKEGQSISQRDARFYQWMKQLVGGLQEVEDPREFLEAVKGELHQEEIYVITPNGEVRNLSYGATPLDFAYNIHTEVGHHCTGARVNGKIVPLKYQLQTGDVVEILTSPHQWPNRGWLGLVKTSRAKSRIRSWLRLEEQQKSLAIGREICDRELRRRNISLKKVIKTGHLKEVLKQLSCNSLDELMMKVGRGKVTVEQISQIVQPPELKTEPEAAPPPALPAAKKSRRRGASIIEIDGIDNMLVNVSRCCMPVPGDEIMGFITSGRGISVHKTSCPNLQSTDPSRWLEVRWSSSPDAVHSANIFVIGRDQRRLLTKVSDAVAVNDAAIMEMEARTVRETGVVTVNMVVEVAGVHHLERLLQQLRKTEGVMEAGRR